MIISWMGEAGIRLQTKDTVVLIDPPGPSVGFKATKQAANIVAITESAGRDWKSISGSPFVIDSPGEYERQNVFVYGLSLPTDPSRVHFRIETEELRLGHLGGLKTKLDNGQVAELEDVDILFVPCGGKTVLNADEAISLINEIEPRVVIPIQYQVTGSTAGYADVNQFLKEIGAKSVDPIDKFKITKKELPTEETQTVILNLQ